MSEPLIVDVSGSISTTLGVLSIASWVFYGLPQVYETYLIKSGDGINMFFVSVWIIGDIFNVTGCIFTEQLPTQVYLAVWFLIMDCIIVGQVLYYDVFAKGKYENIIVEPFVSEYDYLIRDTSLRWVWSYHPSIPSTYLTQYHDPTEPTDIRRGYSGNYTSLQGPLSVDSLSMDFTPRGYDSPSNSFIESGLYGAIPNHTIPDGKGNQTQTLAPGNSTPRRGTTGSMEFFGGRSLFSFYNERTGQEETPRAGRTTRADSSSSVINHDERTSSAERSKNVRRALMVSSLLVFACVLKDNGLLMNQEYASTHDLGNNRILLSSNEEGDALCEGAGVPCFVGLVMGCLSAAVYIMARIPQVLRNFRRKSCKVCYYFGFLSFHFVHIALHHPISIFVDCLSCIVHVAMFVLWSGIIGNLLLSASILVYSVNWLELRYHMPWVIGSLGCVPLDLIIFAQHIAYDKS